MPELENITTPPLTEKTGREILKVLKQISLRSAIIDNLITQDGSKALSALQGYLLKNMINSDRGESQAYDETATYLKGAYCIYQNALYEANTDVSTPEDWNPAHWDKVDLKSLNGAISSLSTVETINLSSYISDSAITVNKAVAYKCGRVISLTIDCIIANTNRHDIVIPNTILPTPKTEYFAMTTLDWQNDSVVSQYGAIVRTSSNIKIMLRASSANLKILASATYIF